MLAGIFSRVVRGKYDSGYGVQDRITVIIFKNIITAGTPAADSASILYRFKRDIHFTGELWASIVAEHHITVGMNFTFQLIPSAKIDHPRVSGTYRRFNICEVHKLFKALGNHGRVHSSLYGNICAAWSGVFCNSSCIRYIFFTS